MQSYQKQLKPDLRHFPRDSLTVQILFGEIRIFPEIYHLHQCLGWISAFLLLPETTFIRSNSGNLVASETHPLCGHTMGRGGCNVASWSNRVATWMNEVKVILSTLHWCGRTLLGIECLRSDDTGMWGPLAASGRIIHASPGRVSIQHIGNPFCTTSSRIVLSVLSVLTICCTQCQAGHELSWYRSHR